jgi:hypothetical protein
MRAVALALLSLLLLDGCMSRPPRRDRSGEVSYNRRDLPPSQGLLSGPDGAWTLYRSGAESEAAPGAAAPAAPEAPAEPARPKRREILLCDPGSRYCEPPESER